MLEADFCWGVQRRSERNRAMVKRDCEVWTVRNSGEENTLQKVCVRSGKNKGVRTQMEFREQMCRRGIRDDATFG